jgi:SAM-dependent methyltransferase
MTERTYVFENADDRRELERLRAIEEVFDPSTRLRLEDAGLAAGWRCLEVGPGAGSVLSWMAGVVGPQGRVTAVDINPRFVRDLGLSNADVVQGDIRTTDLPEAAFDLVHARYVLIHMKDADTAVARLARALKPGGWLVVEEPDFSASRVIGGEPEQLASVEKINRAIHRMYTDMGLDYSLGVKLPALFQKHGLECRSVENDAPFSQGGSGLARMMGLSAEHLRDKYVATGEATADDIDQYRRFSEDPKSWAIYYATVAASGTR